MCKTSDWVLARSRYSNTHLPLLVWTGPDSAKVLVRPTASWLSRRINTLHFSFLILSHGCASIMCHLAVT